MAVRYLFNTSGEYVAFIQGTYMFAPDGTWLGVLAGGNQVYAPDGAFIGYVLDDDRLARNLSEAKKPRIARPARPPRPARPSRPLRRLRMPRLPRPWEDVFADAIVAHQAITQVESFDALANTSLVAADGTFLGLVSRSPYDANSLSNVYGNYGSQYSAKSIFNSYGQYGSRYSQLSPYNEYSRTPPRFVRDGETISYLTTNRFVTPRVDPVAFVAWLKRGAA
jgi:hypothetical protein